MADDTADTTLDAIAAQARSHPTLSPHDVEPLLRQARRAGRGAAFDTLVEHHLGIALDAAIARRDHGVEVIDLYQEASVAVVVAVEEYSSHRRKAAGLSGYVEKVVARHLDAAIDRATEAVRQERRLVGDAELLQAAGVRLRRELAREATDLELGGLLGWPIEHVRLVGSMLHGAEASHDIDLLRYLDGDQGDQD